MLADTMLEQITTCPMCDECGNQDIGIQQDFHEIRLNTSSSLEIPSACALTDNLSRNKASLRKNRYCRTASLITSSTWTPSLRIKSSNAARTSFDREILIVACIFHSLSSKVIITHSRDSAHESLQFSIWLRSNRFRQAVLYGRLVMADPDKKAVYEQAAKIKRKPLFSLTVAVFPSTGSGQALRHGFASQDRLQRASGGRGGPLQLWRRGRGSDRGAR